MLPNEANYFCRTAEHMMGGWPPHGISLGVGLVCRQFFLFVQLCGLPNLTTLLNEMRLGFFLFHVMRGRSLSPACRYVCVLVVYSADNPERDATGYNPPTDLSDTNTQDFINPQRQQFSQTPTQNTAPLRLPSQILTASSSADSGFEVKNNAPSDSPIQNP